ncbi:ATP-binding protein [Aquibacillus koreensis]|uniref:histidine kinase n=1 Tax=Aquibacillus koreensis TaxID=279446 RepID=A0A9X3WJ07_9BACI|nr:ATP-binding protein [Aquibacillus koreensis]MCT2537187.1 ATP-binding protein [Aquibacillus koreensis]MDC3419241.1 ATP-binding protein [Aquibacillus koreensis]
MGASNKRLFFMYAFIAFLIMTSIGSIIIPFVSGTERIIVGLVMLGGLIVLLILIYNIFDRYIKPVRASAMVANELVKGNYKARTYVNHYGDAGKLSSSINKLARSLQEMTIQEKMQGNQLRTVIDNMESGLMLIDEKGYVHLVNRKFIQIFGKEVSEYVGFLYYDVLEQVRIHKAVQEAFLYEEKVKSSFTISMEVEKRYIEIVGAPIFTDTKELKGAVLVFHDITELKRVEQMRKDFVANVSHELKTPITSIRGFAETLLDGDMDSDDLRKQFLAIILTESERLQALVHDLLELSKLERDEFKLRYENIEITKLLSGIIAITEQQAEKKDIEFTATIDDSIYMRADHDRLKQVFINLLNNAINYTPVSGKVELVVKENQEVVEITVSDTGIGIPEEVQNRIFERFYRVDRARSRNTGGTGLGLAIVKHIVEAHKGTIHVESRLDQGSTFRIEIPVSRQV